MERRLAAILSADVTAYSRLMSDDEAATVRTVTDYRAVIAGVVAGHRGRVVDATGDNALAEFASAVDAVECAVVDVRRAGPRQAARETLDAIPVSAAVLVHLDIDVFRDAELPVRTSRTRMD